MRTIRRAIVTLFFSLGVFCAGHTPSAASACTEGENTGPVFGKWTPSARTTVRNETSAMTFLVEVLRGGSEKQDKFIGPGEEASFLAKLGGQKNSAKLTVLLYPEEARKVTECHYNVAESGSGDKFVWSLPEDASEVCPVQDQISVSCKKNFQNQKYRWHTTFTVTDPQ